MTGVIIRTLPLGLLAAAGFLSAAGARVVDALLVVIAHDFSVTVPQMAIVLAAFTVPYGLLQLVIGPLADRVGKARVLTGALLAYSCATFGCALADNLGELTLLRALSGGASAGLIPVCLALIADNTAYADRQVRMSRFLTGVVLAQVAAGPVGGAFGEFITWRGIFLLLAAAAAVLAMLVGRRAGQPERASVTPPHWQFRALLRGHAACLLLLTALDGLVFTGTVPFIAPFLHDRMGVSYFGTGLVIACFGLGTLLYVRTARMLVPRLGERRLVLSGAVVAALGMAVAYRAPHALAFTLAELLLGLGYFMLHSVLQARATELLPDARGTAIAGFAFMLFMGQAAGALVSAHGIDLFGYRAVFGLDGLLILVLGLLLFWLFRPAAR